MKTKVYVETSVISYLSARPSRDLVVAAHQEITRQWWDNERSNDLLTWNCRHIASAHVRPRIDALCRARGIASPQLCTPEELMET